MVAMGGTRPTSLATPGIVADVGGPAAPGGGPYAVAAFRPLPRAAIAAFGKLEPKRAGDWVGFRQSKRQALADAVGLAGFVAHELTCRLVVSEILLPERLGEDEPVAPPN